MNKFRLVLAILLVAVLGYLGYVNLPKTKQVHYYVAHMVEENRIKTLTTTAMVDGKPREVTVAIPFPVSRPVREAKSVDVLPTIEEYLRFGIIVLGTLAGFYYMWIVFSALHRNKKSGAKPTADTRDTEKRADKIVTFVFGLILGFVGGGGKVANHPATVPSNESVEPFDEAAPAANEIITPMPKGDEPDVPKFVPDGPT